MMNKKNKMFLSIGIICVLIISLSIFIYIRGNIKPNSPMLTNSPSVLTQSPTISDANKSIQGFTERVVVNGMVAIKSFDDLILDSDVIIRGKVKDNQCKWRYPDRKKVADAYTIMTDTYVEIEQIFKGEPYDKKNIVVTTRRGIMDGVELISEGYPDFGKDEEVILFLSKDDGQLRYTDRNYYILTGMFQGKFTLDKNDATGNLYTMKNGSEPEKIYLDKFNSLIQQTNEKEKKSPRKKHTKEEIRKINDKYFGGK